MGVMRHIFYYSLFLILSSVSGGGFAYAQPTSEVKATDYRQSYLANPYYNQMATEALEHKPPRFDFMKFRSYYSQTRQYDPMGTRILKDLDELAFIVMNDDDPERAATALFGYKTLVKDHLAHIDVVLHALALAREDRRFGDYKFYQWVRDGLMNTVVISGDGYTLAGAYDVITLSEETMLFNRMGFQQIDSQMVKESIVYYNMHDIVDVNTGEKRAVFVNTSIPMRYLEALEKDRKGGFLPGWQWQ